MNSFFGLFVLGLKCSVVRVGGFVYGVVVSDLFSWMLVGKLIGKGGFINLGVIFVMFCNFDLEICYVVLEDFEVLK